MAQRGATEDLEEKANAREKELARTVSGYADAIRQVRWQEVQQNLGKQEVAIEFVQCKINFPKKTDSTLYAALVLKKEAANPVFIPLFEEKQLLALLQPSKTEANTVHFASLYASRGIKPLRTQTLADLFDLLWKPLEPELNEVRKIYFSPAGALHRLALGAIPMPGKSGTLADRYEFVELGSMRQLVVPAAYQPANNDAVLFGGLHYEADSPMAPVVPALPAEKPSPVLQPEMAARGLVHRGDSWEYLPGTEAEVSSIGRQLKQKKLAVQIFRDSSGTEEAFKNLGKNKPSPRILHLATHGFFFPDPSKKQLEGASEPVFKTSDNPMIRSGLLLAGANHAWKTGETLQPGREDGILTAYEISQMNLSNTELVVLSACETGLGDITGNEGVYGLQRAFKIAGAKYLIMSLWQVPDRQTSLLMTAFYKKWLSEKRSIPEAFRAAQKELREAGLDPYQWAGFVLVE